MGDANLVEKISYTAIIGTAIVGVPLIIAAAAYVGWQLFSFKYSNQARPQGNYLMFSPWVHSPESDRYQKLIETDIICDITDKVNSGGIHYYRFDCGQAPFGKGANNHVVGWLPEERVSPK